MTLIAFGVNHKTAPVDIRERVAFGPERLEEALQQLTSTDGVNEAAILSTCNRTEIYCGVEDDSSTNSNAVIDWLGRFHELKSADVKPYIYEHSERLAVRHILRVASGLDSMVLGEPQILGQIKKAYQNANSAGTVGPRLNRLFQHTFSVAKQVRTDTAIGASAISVAFAAVSLSKQIFTDLSRHTALLVGAGETIELVARHLHESGISRIIVANRTLSKAHTLAMEFDGYAIELSEIPSHLPEADIVISSTGSPLPILGKGMVEAAIRKRKHRPVFMVDIAVPRDIEPQVGELDDVYLYTVDDLTAIIEENLKSRQEAAKQAEEIIDTQVTHFMGWLQSLQAVATIRSYRETAEQQRDMMQEQALHQLRLGRDPEQVLAEMARQLTNKLLHPACAGLRRAGYDGREDLLQAAGEIFDIRNDD